MKEPVFLDNSTPPDFIALNNAYGDHLSGLLDIFLRFDLKKEWKYYNKKSGWILKIKLGNKTICYLQPFNKNADIIFVISKAEEDALLTNPGLSSVLKDRIIKEVKHAEGKSVRIEILSRNDITQAEIILRLKARAKK